MFNADQCQYCVNQNSLICARCKELSDGNANIPPFNPFKSANVEYYERTGRGRNFGNDFRFISETEQYRED